jgi:hypothetical protein
MLVDYRCFDFCIDNVVQPFTNDFPRAEIYEILSPDLLHQVIKGGFKDHLVAWVEEYLTIKYRSKKRVAEIMNDIDRR